MKQIRGLFRMCGCLALAVVLLLTSACGGGSAVESGTEAQTGDESGRPLTIAGDGSYVIVYPEGDSFAWRMANFLAMELNQVVGIQLKTVSDSTAPAECEILVGQTNREESAAARRKMGDTGDLIVSAVGRRVVILAVAERYYEAAIDHLLGLLLQEKQLQIPAEHEYLQICDEIRSFAADERVGDGKTAVEITLRLESDAAEAGVYIGSAKNATGLFGCPGYCLMASAGRLTLYDTSGNSGKVLASRRLIGITVSDEVRIRLETEGTVIRGYLLDDAEGVEPWPEFEIPAKKCEGFAAGYVQFAGEACAYRDLKVVSSAASSVPSKTYTNTVYENYPDPDVIYHEGTFYLYGTGGEGGYRVHSSKDLINWKDEGVAVAFGLWGITKNYWAPDLEYINGKFYMVTSCDENIGITVSDSPLGPFLPLTEQVLYEKSIDGHLFVDEDGRIYLYYVSWSRKYGIYGVELDASLQPKGEPKLLLCAEEEWEKQESAVAEGPYMLKHNGVYYLTYSGSNYISQAYAVGYAVSDSPLGTYAKYADNPIMIGNSFIAGTAHHCILKLPASEEMLIIYHCHDSMTQIHDRDVCIDRIRFAPTKDGVRLEIYGPTVTPQPYPRVP